MKLHQMKDGRYYRNLGYLDSGSQPKFYLGRDASAAMIRAGKIDQVWTRVSEWARRDGVEPTWFGWTYDLARAIAEGKPYQPFGPSAEELARELGVEAPRRVGKLPPGAPGAATAQMLYEAIAAYIADVEERYPTLWGTGKVRLIEFLQEQMPDMPLDDLDTPVIEEMIENVAARPVSKKTKKPISVSWAKNVIKEFRVFLRWLNKSRAWRWTRPNDYDVLPVRIGRTQEERAQITSLAVKTFSPDELQTLWEYALPWERLLMVLGLNCGFGMAEIATLRVDEVFFDQPHPSARQIGLDPPDQTGSWIRRLRGKSDVYGEWRLWDVAVAGLRWVRANRPHPSLVVTTKTGGVLHPEGQRNNQIAHSWQRLLARVQKDHHEFPSRSFNKLRKTAINFVRQAAGEEVASLFASHGTPVHDDLIRVYANPRWVALHAATEQVLEKLASVFVVADPFPPGEVQGGPNISRATVAEIQRLAATGLKSGAIAKQVGVSRETARRWSSRATSA
jgi:hypothetical protein